MPLAAHLAAIASDQGATTAVRFGEGEAWGYARLAAAVRQQAAALSGLRLPRGSIVAQTADTRELLLGTLAAPVAGYAYLPLETATTSARWQALCELGSDRMQRLDRWPDKDGDRDEDADGSPPPPVAGSTALVIATSGSEGTPKAVVHRHASLAAAAHASAQRLPLSPGDVWLNCLPLFHIGGQAILWRCFMAGATVLIHERFDATAAWRAIRNGDVTHISLVPAMLAQLLDIADTPPPTLRAALIGGAALSRPLWLRARDAGWPLCISYGMTETAAQIAMQPPTDDWQEGLVGRPLPGAEITITADGRIRIGGAQVMRGYLDTGNTPGIGLEDGAFVSGDLGRFDDSGRLVVLGRADDMLVSGGRNIHPQEIETLLACCPGISDSAVTATPDPVWGDLITALVVGDGEAGTIERWCRESIPAALRPRRILHVGALPRTPLGKLERKALPALAAETRR